METRIYISAIVKNEDKFLILKRAEDSKFAPGQWEFVNGSPDSGETCEQTLLRELREETGQSGEIIKSLPVYETTDSDGHWIVIPYLTKLHSSEMKISTEHSAYKWVWLDELQAISELKADIAKLTGQI